MRSGRRTPVVRARKAPLSGTYSVTSCAHACASWSTVETGWAEGLESVKRAHQVAREYPMLRASPKAGWKGRPTTS